MHPGWGPGVLRELSGPGPRFLRVEEPWARWRWTVQVAVEVHVSSSCYSFSGHFAGPERVELLAPRMDSAMADVDVVLVAPGFGRGPGRTPGIPVVVDISYGTSGTVGTSWHGIVCLNMKRLLLVLSRTENQMLFGFQCNYI